MDEIARLELEFDTGNAGSDADKFAGKLDNVGAHAENMGTAMTRAVNSIKTGLQFLGLGFGLLKIGQAIQDAIQLAARYQTLGVVMNHLGAEWGYSASQMNTFTKALQANGMSMNDSRQAVVNLMQSNIDLSNAAKLAAAAQNIATTSGRSSAEVYRALLMSIESGSTRMLRNMGVQVNFNSALNKFGQQIGRNAQELGPYNTLQARTNEVIRAATQSQGAHTAALNTADEQMRLLSESASDFKTKLGGAFQPAYTEIILAFAHSLEFASNNLGLITGALIAFTVRGIAPTTLRIADFISKQAQMSRAVLAGNAVMIGSNSVEAMAVKSKASLAFAAYDTAVAARDEAAAAVKAAIGEAAQATASKALATAQAEVVAAEEATTIATRELSVAMLASPMTIIMIAITALGFAYDALTHKMETATDVSSKFGDQMDKIDPKVQASIAKAQEYADKHNLGPVTDAGKDAQSGVEKARKDREASVFSLVSTTRSNLFLPQKEGVSELLKLEGAYKHGNITIADYSTKVEALGEKYKDLNSTTADILTDLQAEALATSKLKEVKDQLTGAIKNQSDAESAAGVIADRATREQQHQAEVQKQRQKILQTQGVRGLSAYDATIGKTQEDKRTYLQAKIDERPDALSGVTPEQLMKVKSEKDISNLADTFKLPANNPILADRRSQFIEATRTAVTNADSFGSAAATANMQAYTTSLEQADAALSIANRNTYGAAQDQERLSKAYRVSTDETGNNAIAVRKAQVEIAGLVAWRSLDANATNKQRDAAAAAARTLTTMTQQQTLAASATSELTRARIAAVDAGTLDTAYQSNDPAAIARAQRDIAVSRATEPGGKLEGASASEVAKYSSDLDATKVSAGNKATSDLTLRANGLRAIAAASLQSKQAVMEATQADAIQHQVESLGIADDEKRQRVLEELTAATKEHDELTQTAANNAALRDQQNALDLMRMETAATLDGVAALEKFQIAKAGITASQNYVGPEAGRADAIRAAQDQARQGIMLQRSTEMANAFRAPILSAINDVDTGFTNLFQKILDNGITSFQQLGREIEKTLHKALADFVSSQLEATVRQKITDIYRTSTGQITVGGGAGTSAASRLIPSGQKGVMNVNIDSYGSQKISSMVATAVATGSTLGASGHGNGGPGISGNIFGPGTDLLGVFNANKPGGIPQGTGATQSAGISKAGKALGYAGIAVGGWQAGQAIGQMTTNHAVGLLGGAAAGAAQGAALGSMLGPEGTMIGAGIGALTGAISGFASVGKISHDAARALQEGENSLANAMAAFKESATMTQSKLVDQFRQDTQTQQSLIAQANSALPGKKYEAQRNADIAQINADAAAAHATDIANFFIDINQQLAAIQGTTHAADLYNLSLAYENNQRSMAAAGATAEQAAEATTLYTDSVAKLNTEYALSISDAKGKITVEGLQAQGATYAASRIQMQIDQQNEMNAVIEKWGATNPEIIQQLKEVQALQTANGAEQIASANRNAVAGFKVSGYAYQFETFEDQFLKNLDTLYGIQNKSTPSLSPTPVAPVPPLTINLPPGSITIDGNKSPIEMATDMVTGLRQIQASKGGGNVRLSDTLDTISAF